MIQKLIITFTLTLFSAQGFSQESIEDFFSSPPEQIVTLSKSHDFLIGGIIHPLSGQPCLHQIDLVAQGAQSIELKRSFIPNYTPLNEHKGQISPSKSYYGGWTYFPHTHLNVFRKSRKKGKKNIVKETIVSVADPQGVALSYEIKLGKTELKTKPWGICNGIGDYPSGAYDPRNTSISIEGMKVTLEAPDGTKRYYSISDQYELTLDKKNYSCLYCLLRKEILPNGKVLRYYYNKDRQVCKINSLDPTESYVYASLDLDLSFKGDGAICSTNTGSSATYKKDTAHFFKEIKGGRYVDLLYPLRLTNVSSPSFRNEAIDYYTDQNGNSRLISYLGKHSLFKCHYLALPKKVKYDRSLQGIDNRLLVGQLHLPSLSSNTKDFDPVYSIEYAPGFPGEEASTTTVSHSDNIKTIYKFNPQMLPETISYLDQNGTLIKTKTFKWTNNQWLQSITISDGQQHVLSEKVFKYDSFGNPISEVLKGDLTGNDLIESYEIKRTFSQDRRNLILEEEHSNGKVINYTYLPDTNLITSCLVKQKGSNYLKREFRRYDNYYNLIQIIQDDGSEDHAEDFTNVSERKITSYRLRQQAPFLHMPEEIEVKYFENGVEKPFKKACLTYDQWGNVSEENVYDSEGKFAYTIYKAYDEQGNLLSETNALGQKALYTYDEYGRAKTSTNFSNNFTIFKNYDVKGRLIETKEVGEDKTVREYTFAYDHKDRLTKKTDSYKHSTFYSYDLIADKPIQIDQPLLHSSEGRILAVTDKASYDALGRKIVSVDPNGNETNYHYNVYGSPTTIIYPDQSKEILSYHENGLIASHIYPNGLKIDYLHDILGNITCKSYFINDNFIGQEIFEYKGSKLSKTTDLESNSTQYTYDGLGRKIGKEKCGCLTTYQYDFLGNIAVICEENGNNSLYTHYEYDLLGQILEKKNTNADGKILTQISYSYDCNGNVQAIKKNINGQNAIDIFTYDSFNREICHQDPQGNLTITQYDENTFNQHGQQVLKKTIKDPQQISTVKMYDPYSRLVKEEKLNAASQIIAAEEIDYDPCGNQLLHQNHVYQKTNYINTRNVKSVYDSCNRIKSMTRAFGTPEARTTALTYYPNGKLASKTTPDGVTLNYTYDGLDNLKSINSSDGKLLHTFIYNRIGYLLSASDELNNLKIVREVDAHGNTLSEKFPNGMVVKKNYDLFHRPTSITLPDGSKVVYNYDPLFLRSVKRLSSCGETLYNHTYQTYDESGYLLTENLIGNCGSVFHTTDIKGQSVSISSNYFKEDCKFDSVGNLTNQVINKTNRIFSHDDLSQIISEPDHTYVHNSLYNRTQDNEKKYQYNGLDEHLSYEDFSCSYDLRGNLIEKSVLGQTQTFAYDPLNRLIEAVIGSKKIFFNYDPLGRRTSKTIQDINGNKFKEYILYDGDHDIGTISEKGDINQLRILGLGNHLKRSIAIELEGKIYAPFQDNQGNVRELVDITSNVLAATYDYTAFGKQLLSNNEVFNPWQYASKRFDTDLGLINFGKRDYDPLLGRWLSVDPAGFIASHNLYQFNFNNPFRYTDPDGQFAFAIPLLYGVFGAGATGATIISIEIAATDLIIAAITTGALAMVLS